MEKFSMVRLFQTNFKFLSNFICLILVVFCFLFFSRLSAQNNPLSDTITIASWNIQMLPEIYSPLSKLVRKKQKIRCPKIIQYLKTNHTL